MWVKTPLKSTCGKEVVQLGHTSRRISRLAAGKKVIIVNLRYFSAWNTGILSYKTDQYFNLCDITLVNLCQKCQKRITKITVFNSTVTENYGDTLGQLDI